MADSIGSVGLVIGADISQFTSDMGKAALIAQREMQNVANSQAIADKQAQKFIQSLKDEAATFGKTRDEILKYRAEQMGMTQQAQGYIDSIAKARKEQEALGNGLEHVGFQSAGAKRELLVLAHEMSQGNYTRFAGSLMVIGERTNIMSLAFSGAGLAILTAGAAVAGFIALVIKGEMEQTAFNNSMKLTNNFAGQTNDSFAGIAKAASEMSNSTLSASRSMEQAFVSTGRVGPATLQLMTQTALEFGRVSGEKADEVVKDFVRMTEGVTKWAAQSNQQYHFLTVAQYEHIRALEEEGKAEEAEKLALAALQGQIQSTSTNLGFMERAWRGIKGAASEAIDAMKAWGREQTPLMLAQTQVNFAKSQVARAQNSGGTGQAEMANLARAEQALQAAQAQASQQQASANARAQGLADQERAIKASDFLKNLREQTNEQAKLNKELTEYHAAVKAMGDAGKPVSAQQQAADEAAIRAKFGSKGIGQAGRIEKEQGQAALQQIKDNLKAQEDAITAHQSALKFLYQNGETSAADFYSQMRQLDNDALQAKLAANEKSIQVDKDLMAKYSGKNQAEERIKLQKDIDHLTADSAKAQQDAAQKIIQANQQEAQSMKTLADQVANFNASVLESQGQFEAASALRMMAAIDKAKKLAMQAAAPTSTGSFSRMDRGQQLDSPIDLQGYIRQQEVLRQTQDVKKQIAQIDAQHSTEESLYLLAAQRSGASLLEQENAMRVMRQQAIADQEQLVQKIEALAKAANPGDPVVLFAQQLRLNLEKARDEVDPALTRLREASKSAADGIASDLTSAMTKWKGAQDLLKSIAQTLLNSSMKTLVTDPLKTSLEGMFKNLTEGDNPIAGMFKSAMGIGGGSTASATALGGLTTSAEAAATALAQIAALGGVSVPGGGGGFGGFGGMSISGFQAALSGTSIGASGFGTGLAYGSQDLGLFLADGGDVAPGNWATVGENGPERIYAGRGGGVSVAPNQPANAAAGSSDMKLTIVNNTSAPIGKVTHTQLSPTEHAFIIDEATKAVAGHLYDANSQVSRAMTHNYGIRRNRN